MSSRRSIGLPITLAIFMIVLLVALTVGWILLAVYGLLGDAKMAGLYWTLLSVGTTSLVLVLVGTVMYLALSIKAISLNQRQSNFIDSVTHELKSPIASLKLYVQTLSRRHVSQSQTEGFYRYMLEDVERLDGLINHLLDAARLDRDSTDEQREEIELSQLLADCAHSVCVRYRVPAETVRVAVQPHAVTARRVDLDMIFRNLIDNAVKYAGEHPQVEITSRLDEGHLGVICIRDNGPGIPQPLRRKIFGRFVRLGAELERKQPGTGLGLYIVRTLVKRNRGRIRVRDTEEGKGTVFEVCLPGCKPIEETAQAGSDDDSGPDKTVRTSLPGTFPSARQQP